MYSTVCIILPLRCIPFRYLDTLKCSGSEPVLSLGTRQKLWPENDTENYNSGVEKAQCGAAFQKIFTSLWETFCAFLAAPCMWVHLVNTLVPPSIHQLSAPALNNGGRKSVVLDFFFFFFLIPNNGNQNEKTNKIKTIFPMYFIMSIFLVKYIK